MHAETNFGLDVKRLLLSSDINQNLNDWLHFSKSPANQIPYHVPSSSWYCMCTDGQRDVVKLVGAYLQLLVANSPKISTYFSAETLT
jgi:hypothetical protein